jgi:hypothetical protein
LAVLNADMKITPVSIKIVAELSAKRAVTVSRSLERLLHGDYTGNNDTVKPHRQEQGAEAYQQAFSLLHRHCSCEAPATDLTMQCTPGKHRPARRADIKQS